MDIKDLKIGDRVRFLNAHDHKIYPDIYPAVGTIGKVIALDEYVGSARVIRVIRVIWPEGSTSDNDICWCGVDDIEPVDNENEIADRWSDGYNTGLNDAWEAAKKIFLLPSEGGLSITDIGLIFGSREHSDLTASKVVSKINEYEKKKKAEEEIKVGDEVYRSLGSSGYLPFIVLYESKGWLFGRRSDGGLESCDKSKARKTGRFFPRIAEYVKQINDEIEQIKEE